MFGTAAGETPEPDAGTQPAATADVAGGPGTATSDADAGPRVRLHLAGRDRSLVISQTSVDRIARGVRAVLREPFSSRPWRELCHFCVSSVLAGAACFVVVALLGAGSVLMVTFVGLFVIATAVRLARGFGSWHRSLGHWLLGESVLEPAAFAPRPGMLGWAQSAVRDRAGWRALAYVLLRVVLGFVGIFVALSFWVTAVTCLTYPVTGNGNVRPGEIPIMIEILRGGYFTALGTTGFFHGAWIVLTGVVVFFVAPWPMRLVVTLDRGLMRSLLGPDAVATRTRVLEEARAQTVDDAAATLRRIERDLHDGTQAQLVALAMRLGQAKEALASAAEPDVDEARRLVVEAHRGAKEAIVELRDLARGIHPPVLDTGLEGALTTLAARSALPTGLNVTMRERPTAAIEAIAYFCGAELLANVAQHAGASRASISCVQHGRWLRLVVRDDGQGGARQAVVGSASSGLAGLAERVGAVDGRIDIESPQGGPTVVTVDLPLHA
jgi:signal transduction histidine kinase